MDNLKWCAKQSKGIRLIEPNLLIANDYFKKADDSLVMISTTESKVWKCVGAYYACYEALYALLQKAGVKCEIHDCTIKLMPFFNFTEDEVSLIEFLKNQRINAQYYVDRDYSLAEIEKVKKFILSCKYKFDDLNFSEIRNKIQNSI
jgi:uncharacterized protein (UPF0332 family)